MLILKQGCKAFALSIAMIMLYGMAIAKGKKMDRQIMINGGTRGISTGYVLNGAVGQTAPTLIFLICSLRILAESPRRAL